jgi:hypothetical protein
MPSHDGFRALKAWRYVGVYGPDLMLCAAVVRIGRARQSFWAVWDRAAGRLHERTTLGRRAVALAPGRLVIVDRAVQVELALAETGGIEAICPAGASYAWTRKQLGVAASGTVAIDGVRRNLRYAAVIDDTAGYYPRHTSWRWSAGVGHSTDGRDVAWNLVSGVNDPPGRSERIVLVGADGFEPPPSSFGDDLEAVDGLRFDAEAVREKAENLVLVRSRYRQPFGTFSGVLPGGVELADGYGVMEQHEVWW